MSEWSNMKKCRQYLQRFIKIWKIGSRNIANIMPAGCFWVSIWIIYFHPACWCLSILENKLNTLRQRQIGRHLKAIFSNAFSWMQMCEFRLRFPQRLFLRFELTIFQYWFRWWLRADQATSHYLNQWWLFKGRIYASPGFNDLNWRRLRTFYRIKWL